MESKWIKEKDQLIEDIFINKKSYEEVGRKYGCSGSNIKKVMKNTLNIELPDKRVINSLETFNKIGLQGTCKCCGKPISKSKTYCNFTCEHTYLHKLAYQKIIDGDSSIMKANYVPKAFKEDILEEQGGVCAICGMKPMWNEKPLVFILDHIDGHASNNKRDNLRLICPNCDSQLDTYKSKNKCGERSYYRYHRSALDESQEVESA